MGRIAILLFPLDGTSILVARLSLYVNSCASTCTYVHDSGLFATTRLTCICQGRQRQHAAGGAVGNDRL
jgi:hypothetical protein